MHLFDYLYFVFNGKMRKGFNFLMAPCIWLAIPICQLTDHFNLNKYIGLAITLAVCVGPYIIIDHIYNRTGGRGDFVIKYFKNSQYNKIGWKALVLAVWVILWMVLPLVLYILHKKGEI